MPLYEFDDLVAAIRNALISARQAVKKRQAEKWEAYFDQDKEDKLKPKTIIFCSPETQVEDNKRAMLEVPVLSLYPRQSLTITELSVEFDCVIREFKDDKKPGAKRLVMSLRPWQEKQRPGIDKVRISYSGLDTLQGLALINEQVFKELS